jgi:amino acid permease
VANRTGFRVRPLTAVLIVVAIALVAVAVVYFTTTATKLPSFFPGHQAGSTRHHTKHGIAVLGLAVLALIGAWFTTSPGGEHTGPN